MTEEISPTQGHDLFVGLGVKLLRDAFPDAQILGADARVGLRFIDEAPQCPSFGGYRPDALLAIGCSVVLVEAKAFEDLGTPHSLAQLGRARDLLEGNERLKFFLVVYGAPVGAEARDLVLPGWLFGNTRVQISVFSEKWEEKYETL